VLSKGDTVQAHHLLGPHPDPHKPFPFSISYTMQEAKEEMGACGTNREIEMPMQPAVGTELCAGA
jgi:hypothetical protein|tara:strand:+ start:2701 stop:2895 length:195 start_codon:yes stop_codon:yes gene_type:complete